MTHEANSSSVSFPNRRSVGRPFIGLSPLGVGASSTRLCFECLDVGTFRSVFRTRLSKE